MNEETEAQRVKEPVQDMYLECKYSRLAGVHSVHIRLHSLSLFFYAGSLLFQQRINTLTTLGPTHQGKEKQKLTSLVLVSM